MVSVPAGRLLAVASAMFVQVTLVPVRDCCHWYRYMALYPPLTAPSPLISGDAEFGQTYTVFLSSMLSLQVSSSVCNTPTRLVMTFTDELIELFVLVVLFTFL